MTSSEVKHTPGPWEVDMDPETGEWRVCEKAGVVSTIHETRSWEAVSHIVRTTRNPDGSGGFMVAECPANVGNRIADARLISAAPDLYWFVRQIFNGIDAGMLKFDTPADETLANVLARGRAAMAKVEAS